jgi:hypothetical protein
MKKIHEKLSRCSAYKTIKAAMEEAVYDTYATTDFKEKFCSFVEKFEFQQNNWLSGLYNDRHKWVPALLRNIFGRVCQLRNEVRVYMLSLKDISIQQQLYANL